MAYELTAAAIHHPHPNLTAPAWAVLVTLCDAVNQCTTMTTAWPSVTTLARITRYSPRTVQAALRLLEKLGLIYSQQRTGTSTRYAITLEPTPAAPAPLPPENEPNAPPTPAAAAPLPRSCCTPPPQLLHPNQEENQEENQINTAPPPPPPPPPALVPAAPLYVWPEIFQNLPSLLLDDWATVRKAKKKPATPTATEARHFAEQAAIAGLTIEKAVELCAVRHWTRLDAAWIPPAAPATPAEAPAVPPPPPPPPLTPEQAAEQAAAAAAARAQLSLWTKGAGDEDDLQPVPPTDELQGPPWAINIVRAVRSGGGGAPSFRAVEMACDALRIQRRALLAELKGA